MSVDLPLEKCSEGIRRAIVLSGGGARGAYEAGVLDFVFGKLAERLGFVPSFEIYAGTSVGSVHACHLAGHADRPDEGIRRLCELWRKMSFSTVYSFGVGDALNFSRTMFGFVTGKSVGIDNDANRVHGLLNTTPLERLVVENIPWRRLRRNVQRGRVAALCVSATEIATGRTVVFVDNPERSVPSWTRDAMLVARPARIGPEHALASAAIPFLFPVVRVEGTYFCDGSLRQHTPLAPALRLGSNRVLSIGLRHKGAPRIEQPLAMQRLEHMRSAGFLFGKILNALLTDRLEQDLANMRVINRIIRAGVECFGDQHLARINANVEHERGMGFRLVEDCFVQPSQDIGAIAAEHVRRLRNNPSRTWIGSVAFRTLTRGSPEQEADLMSYLLFDGEYAADLIDLGRSDAEAAEDDIVRFLLG